MSELYTIGSVCSGIEAASVALNPLGFKTIWLSEIDAAPSAVLAHHYPTVPNLGDMTKIAALIRDCFVPAPDMLCGGTPCFTAGHMVLCSTGYKPIELVEVGDLVVTHTGRMQRVLRIGSKLAKVGKLTGVGMASGIVTTPDHPFLSVDFRMQSTKRNGSYARVEHCGDPEWVAAKDLPGKNWCALTRHESSDHKPTSTKFDAATAMYLAGMYLGDGYIRKWGSKTKRAVVFCLNKSKSEKFKAAAPGAGTFSEEVRGAIKVTVCDTAFANWLVAQFGELSHGKRIPAWVMGHEFGAELLRGYMDTDGGMTKNGFVANSVSHALALGIADLANCHGYSAGLTFMKTPDTHIIEGRTVNQRDYWSVKAADFDVSRKSRVRHNYLLRLIQAYIPCGTDTVYNIEVEGDNSYVLNGAVVHNCQAFSIAGLRNSLDDDRGNLSLVFCEIADEIDKRRAADGLLPATILWENVPGVLSTSDNAFGCFLAGLAGEDDPIEPPGAKWSNAGCVYGPKRAVAWRVFDAQYFGVAQRRRRVFVVASAREGFDPAEVLFEFDGVRRDTPPSREAGESITHDVAPCLTSSGRGVERGGDTRGQDPVVAVPFAPALSHCLNAGGMGRQDWETETMVVDAAPAALSVALRGREGGATAELGDEIAGTLRASTGGGDKAHVLAPIPIDMRQASRGATMTNNRAEGSSGGAPGTGIGKPGDPSPTISTSHVPAIAFDSRQDCVSSTEVFGALGSSSPQAQAVASFAFAQNTRDEVRLIGGDGELSGALAAQPGMKQTTYVVPGGMAVRRLTPVECHRLQGFADDYLGQVLVRGKPMADGPMYKALGNSWAVPNVVWIGRRIHSMLMRGHV